MKKNSINSILALAAVVFIVGGCGMLKSGEKNVQVNMNNNGTVPTSTVNTNSTPADGMPSGKAIAWELGNSLSLAAILYDLKGTESSDSLSKAKILAQDVGATVPSFPAKSGDSIKDKAAILAYLLKDVNTSISGKVKEKYGKEEAALFEMSLKSNVLLIIYGPGDKSGLAAAKMIRDNAAIAGLPENLWMPLVSKIESDASFDDVKNAVLTMQSDVSKSLKK